MSRANKITAAMREARKRPTDPAHWVNRIIKEQCQSPRTHAYIKRRIGEFDFKRLRASVSVYRALRKVGIVK